jgi:hypothetical protein
LKFVKKPLVIDIKPKSLGCGVKIGAVDKERDLFIMARHLCSLLFVVCGGLKRGLGP